MKRVRTLSSTLAWLLTLGAGSTTFGQPCQPTNGTYTMSIAFPGGPNVVTCPGNVIGIRVMADAVDGGGTPIPIGAFGFNVKINAPGSVITVNLNPAYNVSGSGLSFINGTDVGATGIADPQAPTPTGPIVLATIVFQPTPVAAQQTAAVDFSGSITLPNGFPLENHLVDDGTLCDVLPSTTPPLNLVSGSLNLLTCPQNIIRGDCNNNGIVGGTFGDALTILTYLFIGPITVPCENACDANDNEAIEISDAILLINWIVNAGAAPPAPTPMFPVGSGFLGDCGPDPTPGGLSCNGPICP